MNVKLDIKPLVKKCRGYCAAYSVKNVIPELDLNSIIEALGNEPFIGIDDFDNLEALGLKVKFCSPKDNLFELIREKPLIYLDFKNKHCGIIYGYDDNHFYIFDLKKKRKIKQEDFYPRLYGIIALKKLKK